MAGSSRAGAQNTVILAVDDGLLRRRNGRIVQMNLGQTREAQLHRLDEALLLEA